MMAMLPLLQILEQGGQFIQSIKHGLTINGIDAGPPRRPLRPLNRSEKRQLTESIERLQKTLACLQKDQL
jgi:Dihydrodipicolinate synthase/N-acetylneuraminate lyase